jgi:hypothetical protein
MSFETRRYRCPPEGAASPGEQCTFVMGSAQLIHQQQNLSLATAHLAPGIHVENVQNRSRDHPAQ